MTANEQMTCSKCDRAKRAQHFKAPPVGLGSHYDAFLRGICIGCQRRHVEAQLDGSLGITLGSALAVEVGCQLSILRRAERVATEHDSSLPRILPPSTP